jgi:hexosaminidase
VLTEVMGLFPGAFMHVGGDEAIKNQWAGQSPGPGQDPRLHLHNEEEMQTGSSGRWTGFSTSGGGG